MEETFESNLIGELNHIRKNPKAYAKKLRTYATYFDGDVLRPPQLKNGILTKEGKKAYLEAATYLESVPKIDILITDNTLSMACAETCDEMTKYSTVEKTSYIDHQAIIDKYFTISGEFGQSIDFGSETPEFVLMNLIVDDGDPRRKNRRMLFNGNYYKVGCSSIPHKSFRRCTVIMFATKVLKKGTARYVSKPVSVPQGNVYQNAEFVRDSDVYGGAGNNGFREEKAPVAQQSVPSYQDAKAKSQGNNYESDIPEGVKKIETTERITVENGVKKKIVKVIKYMENGDIKTEISKEVV